MNSHLSQIQELILKHPHLSDGEKQELEKRIKAINQAWQMDQFRLSRAESDKQVMTVMLEESIHDLEEKRKAIEEQNRELEIDAALERVRSHTMAMTKSSDLLEVAKALREQMGRLNQPELESCIVHLYPDHMQSFDVWYSYRRPGTANTEIISEETKALVRSAWTREVIRKYQSEETEYTIISTGDMLTEWYNELLEFAPTTLEYDAAGNIRVPEILYHHFAKFTGGSLLMISTQEASEASRELLKKAAREFNFAYHRFQDLKQAEAQAREAQIEAALERVRARTLAMQKSEELSDAAAVLFRQLILLSIAPNRLYVGITEANSHHIEFWITDEDGSKVSTMFSGDVTQNDSLANMYDTWKSGRKSIVIEMEGQALANYLRYLSGELHVSFKDGLLQKKRWQYIAFFSKGFIGMASAEEQPPETLDLLERFASVFNLTFTRFNDLKIAEAQARQAMEDLIEIKAARQKAEQALAELKATQRQLIQSEKMASLGELTAGIAHEIQNPLNFVNNFAEVNAELIEEVQGERLKVKGERDEELLTGLLNDIAENEKKISLHGKRADAIVKGMLQHSRGSSGNRELTDLNSLADEYLRLAYHGLRARDKSFNAHFETDFDPGIGKIEMVPQEIGRVLLNLINNAFYAVNEKRKSAGASYKPHILISTHACGDTVEMRVKDNGSGIPEEVVDKIFQPFFTTKPAGQGTGLGLSLCYDIVTKGNGGEIRVETKEAEGTTIIVAFPRSS